MIAAFRVPQENPKREYIDREAVYPLAKKICDAFRSGEYSPVLMPHIILDLIDAIPAADVRPVVRGKWNYTEMYFDDYAWVCSVCGEPWVLNDGTPAENNMNFCPNCGSDMREEQT